ncbi:MAG: hypothetical protein ACRD03_05130 [Acidimicrobiales bacterium]
MTAGRRALVWLAAVVALAAPAVPASAQYPPAAEELAVTDTAPAPGQEILVTGGGFMPGTTVTLTFESTPVFLGRAAVDEHGGFAALVRIPAEATLGWHTIRARGTGRDGLPRELAIPILLTSPAEPPAPPTPGRTTWEGLLGAGSLTLAAMLGLATALALRRRRRASARRASLP